MEVTAAHGADWPYDGAPKQVTICVICHYFLVILYDTWTLDDKVEYMLNPMLVNKDFSIMASN